VLLRRVMDHVRDQNWVAVFLDFLIVVVGIFVGLQVTAWNESRQLEAREQVYLRQLSEDLAAMRAEFSEIVQRGGVRSDRARRAFRALEQCNPELAEPEDFEVVFATYQNQRTATIVDRSYNEMVASGALASMSDRELSGRIAGLFGTLQNYVEFIDGVRISIPQIDRVIWQNVNLTFNEDDRPTLGEFDFDLACANRELRNAVWEIQDLFWDWESITDRTMSQLDSANDLLARRLSG